MCPFGIIGGTNLFHSKVLKGMKKSDVPTTYGTVQAFESPPGEVVFISRHGLESPVPPHRIDHHANIMAMKSMGVKHILGITSVGSLKMEIPPGTLMVPDDFIQLSGIPTFFRDEIKHITPYLNEEIRRVILKTGREHGFPVRAGGVYIQTPGPRFETKAEVRFFSGFADVVGMNMASEATLAGEMEMEYANLSVVDNYGNGISGEITYEEFMEMVRAHQEDLDRFLEFLIPELLKKFK
ncbi:MAG: MTAP family purine nucleoside phosphorylase [Thermoplasmata archaeon]|nr:MTAP family purine nucleoside phosphorylase [Thermoplasmata archaeon]